MLYWCYFSIGAIASVTAKNFVPAKVNSESVCYCRQCKFMCEGHSMLQSLSVVGFCSLDAVQ